MRSCYYFRACTSRVFVLLTRGHGRLTSPLWQAGRLSEGVRVWEEFCQACDQEAQKRTAAAAAGAAAAGTQAPAEHKQKPQVRQQQRAGAGGGLQHTLASFNAALGLFSRMGQIDEVLKVI